MNGQADVEVDYKRKYKNLKRKLKFLVYVSVFILNRPIASAVSVFALISFRWFPFPGAGVFSGGAEESTEETSESFQGQEVCEDSAFM